MALLAILLSLAPQASKAQMQRVHRGDCTPGIADSSVSTLPTRSATRRGLPAPNKKWAPYKAYKQLVILVSYSDTDFNCEDPRDFYDKILNLHGYNEGIGRGCLADYFREQSGGLFKVSFDVFGPYKLSTKANPYDNPSSNTRNYGTTSLRKATEMMIAENREHNFRVYDWDDDNYIDQVIYISAGFAGNQGKKSYGYLWPNSSSFSSVTCPDGRKIISYSASGELWENGKSCGIGTIAHEYSHSLGLPDIYPTANSSFYSVCDEWDLMDGGNFTNFGWCPPNYTAQEKIYLGWLTPTELTASTTITGMQPISEGGDTYIIKNTDNEYLLLENHQFSGWDAGLPGSGLLITHVDFDATSWLNNAVNTSDKHFRHDIVHADNLHYEDWDAIISDRGLSTWADKESLIHNHHLSTSAYPWATDSTSTVNDELSNSSVPPIQWYRSTAQGDSTFQLAITNIQQAPDGTISFNFVKDIIDMGIVHTAPAASPSAQWYTLEGRRLNGRPTAKGIYLHRGKKIVVK